MIRMRDAKKAKNRESLITEGIPVEATIRDFLKENIYERNIVVIRVVAEALLGNESYRFLSEKTFVDNLEGLKIGDTVKIIVDKNDFGQYYFQINKADKI